MTQGYDVDYVKRLEQALLEYVEKYGPTEAAKAVFRDAPQVSVPVESSVPSTDRSLDMGEVPTD